MKSRLIKLVLFIEYLCHQNCLSFEHLLINQATLFDTLKTPIKMELIECGDSVSQAVKWCHMIIMMS